MPIQTCDTHKPLFLLYDQEESSQYPNDSVDVETLYYEDFDEAVKKGEELASEVSKRLGIQMEKLEFAFKESEIRCQKKRSFGGD